MQHFDIMSIRSNVHGGGHDLGEEPNVVNNDTAQSDREHEEVDEEFDENYRLSTTTQRFASKKKKKKKKAKKSLFNQTMV